MRKYFLHVSTALLLLAAFGWFYCSYDILKSRLEESWRTYTGIHGSDGDAEQNKTIGEVQLSGESGNQPSSIATSISFGDLATSSSTSFERLHASTTQPLNKPTQDADDVAQEGDRTATPATATTRATSIATAVPTNNPDDKIVVMGKLSREYTDWVKDIPEWKHAIYTVDDPSSSLSVPANKGREAMVYLTYIIDNYDHLPSVMAFVHAHRDAWHITDNRLHSNAISLKYLNTTFVLQNGYVNLNCKFEPGCPAHVLPFQFHSQVDEARWQNRIPEAWDYFLGINETAMPRVISTPCCAQFAVSRDQVHQRSRDEYMKMRQWLLHTELGDYSSGRVMEYSWHVIFGKEAIYCPKQEVCLCEVYSRCGRGIEGKPGGDPPFGPLGGLPA